MIKYQLYLAMAFLLLVSTRSYSQNDKHISISEAWDAAFANYPGLTEKKAQIRESEYRKTEVKNGFLPQVQVQLQNTYGSYAGSTGAFFPLPGIFNVSGNNRLNGQPDAAANSYGSVLMDWKLFEFGKQRKEVEAAKYAVEEAGSNFNVAKLQLQTKVTKLYINILYNQSKLEWAKENVTRVKEILNLSKSLSEAGLKPGADILLASSSYLQTLAELDDWNGKLSSSRIQLTEVVPLLPESILLSTNRFLTTLAGITGTDSVSNAHPYLDVIGTRILYDRTQEQIAARKIFPFVSLLGGLSSRGSGIGKDGTASTGWSSGFNNTSNNYLVGVGLTWNISSAYNSTVERKRAGQKLLATRSRYDLQALELNTGFQSVSTRIDEQLKQVMKTTQAVQNARNAYDLYLSRYESGLINLTELLQIQLLLQQSEKINIEAYQQLWEQEILRSELSGDFNKISNQFK
ncbi:MAG: TolC family protein [Daejeonella sp.]|nr:TolC family protein [Daejeonella sp.]